MYCLRRYLSNSLPRAITWWNQAGVHTTHSSNAANTEEGNYEVRRDIRSYSEKQQLKRIEVYKTDPPPTRHGYVSKLNPGGLLPRLDTEIRSLPRYQNSKSWSKEKALFGQNDYIDILGDGSVQPWQTVRAPVWLKGYRGNEYSRNIRRLKMTGTQLKKDRPKLHSELNKRIKFLYARLNQRRHSKQHISRKV